MILGTNFCPDPFTKSFYLRHPFAILLHENFTEEGIIVGTIYRDAWETRVFNPAEEARAIS